MGKCFILVSVRKGAQQHRNTPYLFNAKEFDEEAGLYFYSRDPKINKWNVPAPRRINNQIFKQDVQRAIRNAYKYLGD